ncbi:MAG: hypothetical protein EXS14_02955 [Planctomycetes bacterium]|nr:hypothetical protein [Planctomycetota bacterium]
MLVLNMLLLLLLQPSDVRLDGVRLDAFTASRGLSEVGQQVLLTIPAKVFAVPLSVRRGVACYTWKRIGFIVRTQTAGLEEVRRRGGKARVRGRVVATTVAEQQRGAPVCVVVLHELSHSRL